MNILIISQAIYPSQVPRAFRATELAKELGRQGQKVTLYAVLGDHNYQQFEKDNNIKIKNIGRMWFSKINSAGTHNFTIIDRVMKRLFGKLFEYPDIELMFRTVNVLKNEKNVDCVITVGMPYPLHWGAALAKTLFPKKFPKKWIADCGDPYMGSKFDKKFFYFKYIEKWFCSKANYITIPIEEAREGYYKEFKDKIRIIPQGFNFDQLPIPNQYSPNRVPSFAYAGVFYRRKRDPTLFLQYLATLKQDFKFFIFTPNKDLIEPFIEKLGSKIEVHSYVPRDKLLGILIKMDFLINVENGTRIHSPSKLIDYALTTRPILSLDPYHLNTEIINDFLSGDYSKRLIVKDIEQYNIKKVVSKFLELAND
ncbi:MAG TPA: hypothetical protein VN703_08850 [Candidatus Sulfopaludibacter sp.]|nr:hypothetical protein [Candidatus Sulfopaludibacter sp.]